MANTDFKSVDEYLATQPEAAQAALGRVRAVLRRALPEAREVISYQIPAYKAAGGAVLFFAGWKKHYSLYPVTEALAAAFRDDLAPYRLGKGTIRFPLDEPVPEALIERLARFRAREVADLQAAKAAARKAR